MFCVVQRTQWELDSCLLNGHRNVEKIHALMSSLKEGIGKKEGKKGRAISVHFQTKGIGMSWHGESRKTEDLPSFMLAHESSM